MIEKWKLTIHGHNVNNNIRYVTIKDSELEQISFYDS